MIQFHSAPAVPSDDPRLALPQPGDNPPPHRLDRVFDGWPYVLPMAVFLLITFAGGHFSDSFHFAFPLSYVLKTFVVGLLLIWCWKRVRLVRWHGWQLGIVVGVVGVVQWVGMEKLLMSQEWLWWTRMVYDVRGEAFRPDLYFENSTWMYVGFLAVRFLGPVIVVPVMEELFWRDWLWRSLAAPADFRLAQTGEYDRSSVFLIPLFFAAVHVQWLTSIVWALLIAWLLLRTRSIGACIIAHAVTNALLGLWVIGAHYILGWDEWYFW